MHQVRILGRADTWASHDNVRRCQQEWEESKNSKGQVIVQLHSMVSCSSKGGETAHSSSHNAASSSSSISHGIQADPGCDSMSAIEDRICVILPDGKQLVVACQKPVLLKKLKEAVCTQSSISDSVSLFMESEGGTVELSNQDELAKYLALEDRPHIYAT